MAGRSIYTGKRTSFVRPPPAFGFGPTKGAVAGDLKRTSFGGITPEVFAFPARESTSLWRTELKPTYIGAFELHKRRPSEPEIFKPAPYTEEEKLVQFLKTYEGLPLWERQVYNPEISGLKEMELGEYDDNDDFY